MTQEEMNRLMLEQNASRDNFYQAELKRVAELLRQQTYQQMEYKTDDVKIPPPPVVKVDRSRIVARIDCEMLRYWNYHHNGRGIVPRAGAGDALEFGIALHKAMEYILSTTMEGKPLDFGLMEANVIHPFEQTIFNRMLFRENADHAKADHIAKEQAHLLRTLTIGWTIQRLPALLEEYDIVGVEVEYEVPFPASNVSLMLRVDAILRRKADGILHILDFKSLKYLSDDWMVHHEHSLQTLLYLWALGKASGEYIGGVLYEGLLKGGTRKETNKAVPWSGWDTAQSPLCYVYTDGAGHYKHAWTSAKGWRKVHLFDHSTSEVLRILTQCYEEAGEGGLPFWNTVPPVRPTDALVEQTIDSLTRAEKEYANKIIILNNLTDKGMTDEADHKRKQEMELNLGRCYKYGTKYGCPYTRICHGGADPNDATEWVPRTPHHETELDPTVEE
jgi:hypothetical protein